MKSSFLSIPLNLVTDSTLPRAQLIAPAEFAWLTADVPQSQIEDIGLPRVYFLEPAAALGLLFDFAPHQQQQQQQQSISYKKAPRPTSVMVTFDQIMCFDTENPRRLLAAPVELSDPKTKVRAVTRSSGGGGSSSSDVPQALIQTPDSTLLLSFLDCSARDRFYDVCEQVSRAHCNIACCISSATATPEHALDAVMNQKMPAVANASTATATSGSSASAAAPSSGLFSSAPLTATASSSSNQQLKDAMTWRVSVMPYSGLVIHAPRDPSELLHQSLHALMTRRKERDDEREEYEECGTTWRNDPLSEPEYSAIAHPFERLVVECQTIVSQFAAEANALAASDGKQVRAAQLTMDRALSELEIKKDSVRGSAARYGEQLTEWLRVLQEKQQNELDATTRLSQKKQEYAKTLDDADATLAELYNERRWVDAESAKYSAAEYVQIVAKRDALDQALRQAQRAVDAELRGGSAAAPLTTTLKNNNNNGNTGSPQGGNGSASPNRSTSITTDASTRSYSLFSPNRVIKMFTPQRARRDPVAGTSQQQQNSNSSSSNNNKEQTPRTFASMQQQQNKGTGGFFASNSKDDGTPRQNVHDPTPLIAPGMPSSSRCTPKPDHHGLNKPIRIDQAVQQTLHVNASLRNLLELERNGADQDKVELKQLQEKVRASDLVLQGLLNEQGLIAVDVAQMDADNTDKEMRLSELRQQEVLLQGQLEQAAMQRQGLFLVAEKERDQALEQRQRAEQALKERKKETHRILYERTCEMLKESMRSLSVGSSIAE